MPRFTAAAKPAAWFLTALLAAAAVGLAGYAAPHIQAPQSPAARDAARFTLSKGDVWIRDVTLISAERPAPLPHAHVVARGQRIAYVGATPPAGEPSGVTVLDGTGRFLVPGLVDGHVHLAEVPGASAATPAGLDEAYYRQLPRSYVYFGFTAVVDLNVVDRARVEQLRNAEIAPAVFDCGNALVLANGYPMNYLPPEKIGRAHV